MKKGQNQIKKTSEFHNKNIINREIKRHSYNNKTNALNKPLKYIKDTIAKNEYNTINEINRISKRVYRPKINSNIEALIDNNTHKRKLYLNRNKNNKMLLIRNSDSSLPSYNSLTLNNFYNPFKKVKNNRKSNSNLHVINQNKKNHSNKFSNIPKINLEKAKDLTKEFNHKRKAQTSRPLMVKNKLEEIKDVNEDNKIKYTRRLEVKEKKEVLLPNETFKKFEQFEKKEKPFIEIKKNKDGTDIKTIKEVLIKTMIENSLIDIPKMNLLKNAPKVKLIKRKITKEYITTIKNYSDIFDIYDNNNNNNKIENQSKKNKSNHDLIDINKNITNENNHQKLNINPRNGQNMINNEKNKRNIKNTVYSNVINNKINKPHKKKSKSNKKPIIENMIRKNIQHKNYKTISNMHKKNIYNINFTNTVNDNNVNNQKENSSFKNSINNNSKNFNNYQIINNESQPISNIININNTTTNSFSMSESKISNKVFDCPFNLGFDKEEKKIIDKETKLEKLGKFINILNEEKCFIDLNNSQNEANKSPFIDKQSEENILNLMHISDLDLSIKESEENDNENNNTNNGENKNNNDKENLTGSIMFINSNIDQNIHIQNGIDNYSINMDANSLTDNLNIFEGEIDEKKNINNTNEKETEFEFEICDEEKEKIFKPLNVYENKFNLDRINPF